MSATERIDQLIHDARHADGGASFARQIGHTRPAREMAAKRDRLLNEARILYMQHPESEWPDPEHCEWPSPVRTSGGGK